MAEYNLTIVIRDSTGLSNESVLTVIVEDVNEPPVFTHTNADSGQVCLLCLVYYKTNTLLYYDVKRSVYELLGVIIIFNITPTFHIL